MDKNKIDWKKTKYVCYWSTIEIKQIQNHKDHASRNRILVTRPYIKHFGLGNEDIQVLLLSQIKQYLKLKHLFKSTEQLQFIKRSNWSIMKEINVSYRN